MCHCNNAVVAISPQEILSLTLSSYWCANFLNVRRTRRGPPGGPFKSHGTAHDRSLEATSLSPTARNVLLMTLSITMQVRYVCGSQSQFCSYANPSTTTTEKIEKKIVFIFSTKSQRYQSTTTRNSEYTSRKLTPSSAWRVDMCYTKRSSRSLSDEIKNNR